MGAKASKPAQTASRRFPTRAPGSAVPLRSPEVGNARRAGQSATKDETILADGRDPDLAPDDASAAYSARLRHMGVATPLPTFSHSSTATLPTPTPTPTTATIPPRNRTLAALEARRALQARADAEFEDPSRGRGLLDAATVRRALLLRGRGIAAPDIEATLRLRPGVVDRLGPPGVAVPVGVAGMNKQLWGGLHE
ncbi:hypothetical protein SAMD00023353_1202410 [Rosellinia necatrix]|uniref:Helix-turn-helix domain-containing protein n=1 Tax=Rosellinia necatrix TaxID=77044 RepID=A0A1W2TKK8_ROSNE|nr:hypothetical protein SAMD00023353_1202410 [Rosellinia necatrix]